MGRNGIDIMQRFRNSLAYIIMISPNAAVGMVLSSMPAVLPQLAVQLGGRETAQLVASLASFGVIAGGVFSGPLLDRLKIRRCILVSLLLYAVSSFAGIVWATSLAMGISRFALGMAAVFFSSAAVALTAATFTGAARSKVMGLQQATSQVTNVLTVFAVGALARFVGWRSAFLVLFAYAILLFVMSLAGVRPVAIATRLCAVSDIPRARLGFHFWRTCAFALLFGILQMVPMTQLPFLLEASGVAASSWVPFATGASFLFAALGALGFSRAKSQLGTAGAFLLALGLMTGGMILMGMSQYVVLLPVASAIIGFGTGFGNTFLFDHGVEVVDNLQHGRAAGLLFSFVFLGTAVNPITLYPFERLLGQHHSLVGLGVVGLILGVFGLLLRPVPVDAMTATPKPP
jgi:MFS family permease